MIGLNLNNSVAEKHFDIVRDAIQNRIKKILKNGVTEKATKYRPDADMANYLRSLLIDSNLKTLIVAGPSTLEGIISFFRTNYPDSVRPNTSSNIILYNLFVSSCYDKSEFFDKLTFIQNIGLDTCPYCNRNYIYYLSKKKQIKPEIDHFFPKSKYPFLGVSFYNLIPSCQTCNGYAAKHQKDPLRSGLTNPYLVNSSDFSFTYKILTNGIVSSLLDKNSIELKINKNIPGHLNVFKLKELYEQHTDHVIELIIKSKMKYSETYRNYLRSYRDRGLRFNDNEIDRMILGNYASERDVHKRPLAKLYQDIGKELGLY